MRQQQWEPAALALMRIPILYPEQRALAAAALLQAARSLESLGRTDEARRLYREVVGDHADQQRTSAEAASRLESLKTNR